MSIAQKFISIGPFPTYIGEPRYADSFIALPYVDNLTLAQVMALFWNLEQIEFSLTINATFRNLDLVVETVSFSGGFSVSPAAGSGALSGWGFWGNNSALHEVFTVESGSSAVRPPRERVCLGNILTDYFATVIDFAGNQSASSPRGGLRLQLVVLKDPVHANRYRVHHNFTVSIYSNTTTPEYSIGVAGFSGFGGSYGSGTMTIGGITLPWYLTANLYYPGTGTISGVSGSLTVSSTSFTY